MKISFGKSYYTIGSKYRAFDDMTREQKKTTINEALEWLRAKAGRNQFATMEAAEKVRAQMPDHLRDLYYSCEATPMYF